MKKKAIILDLDNTIYAVSSIGEKLFKTLFNLIKNRGEYSGDFELIKTEIMRRPFQYIAKEFSFSERLFEDCMQLLKNLTYDELILPFEDYNEIKKIPIPKYLVTVGFKKLQQSKVRQLNIEQDFKTIFIIDPTESTLSKKDVFLKIMEENSYKANDLIIVGDDIESEIKAGKELGIESLLYDREGKYVSQENNRTIKSFNELSKYIVWV